MNPNAAPLPTLPIQLLLTLGTWLSWPFALQCARSELPASSFSLKNPLPNASPRQQREFELALQEEARSRASSLLEGIARYVETPYRRSVQEAPVIWSRGNARLLDYGRGAPVSAHQPVVLFIPSLINRYYILDLEEERSMVRFLAQQGVYPLVLDWGIPGAFESEFGCGDYVTEILIPAIRFIRQSAQQKIVLAGYCMGGVLALAAARLKPGLLSGLALFATPWNFYCREFSPFVIDSHWLPAMESMIERQQALRADIIHSLFYLTDPWIFEQKFRRFSSLQPDSRAARDFIALEHWVNDGVPMTANVARDCLLGWAQQNMLYDNAWKVGGRIVDPSSIRLPSLVSIPRNDHVVPHECAIALAQKLPDALLIHPGAGHVGMIVGTGAKRELWQPFAEWLRHMPRP
jgi:polyhydroxyalkanoate synthase